MAAEEETPDFGGPHVSQEPKESQQEQTEQMNDILQTLDEIVFGNRNGQKHDDDNATDGSDSSDDSNFGINDKKKHTQRN